MPQQHESPPASSSSASAVDTAADISLSGPHPDSSASVLFSGHDEYIASVARTCRELELYTDVNIVAQDGTVAAHRIVLAACSDFLRGAFLSVPEGLPEFTLMVPSAKKQTVAILINFLYTGKMSLGKHNTQDLQQLVKVLMIDPENVSISASPDEKETSKKISATKSASSPALQQQQQKQQQKLVQSKITFMMKNASSHNAAPVAAKTQPGPKCSKVTSSGDGSKVSPGSRASKRRASAETRSGSPTNAEEGKRSRTVPNSASASVPASPVPASEQQPQLQVIRPSLTSSPSSGRGGRLRRRGRHSSFLQQQQGQKRNPSGQSTAKEGKSSSSSTSGVHDLMNVNTWVCAICRQYDPVLPSGADPGDLENTEWVGCDCSRWFHMLCTRLGEAELEDFSCSRVKLKCLQTPERA